MALDVFFQVNNQDVVTRPFDDQLKQIRMFISWHDQLTKHESMPTMLKFLSWLILYLSIKITADKCGLDHDRRDKILVKNQNDLNKLLGLLQDYPAVINWTRKEKLLEFIYWNNSSSTTFKNHFMAKSNVQEMLKDMNVLNNPELFGGNDSGDDRKEKIKEYLASEQCEFALTFLKRFVDKTKVFDLYNERVFRAIKDLNMVIASPTQGPTLDNDGLEIIEESNGDKDPKDDGKEDLIIIDD